MDEKWLDLCRLAAGIRAGYVDDELCELPPAALVVSSIHRAKGLEFDDVFVTEPAQGPEPADVGEECRILYVGLTRARDEVEMLDLARTWGLHRSDRYDHRWQWTGAQAWMRRGIEFLGTDVDCERPAFGGSRELEDLADWARYASGRLQPGEAVQLSHGAGSDGFYDVLHDGVKIGQTSVDFKQALDSFLFFKQQKKRRYPTSIEDLHVEMVDSVAGTSADAERYGLGPAALWLRPRLVGLGRFVWG
jgi:hypothetical protein